ncbi:hypothetical protein OPT61_g3342 [Boeremia exigua]|uniref:Uncharacterized protein n=1 Tax=Boeremia exigua TaxID=749465 RepID=A0ACC2II51_9PLEO|nr:hypothetical protein OPT61_g3342 [Boeremia exigua]
MKATIHDAITGSADNVRNTPSSGNKKNLNPDGSTLEPKYVKFQRYFEQLIKLGREILARDHTYDRCGHHFLNADRYLRLREKLCTWMCHRKHSTLFTHRDTFFYLAQMAIAMQTIEIVLSLPHQPIRWPGVTPGPSPCWPGVAKQEVYRQFDELIHNGKKLDIKAMPWNRETTFNIRGEVCVCTPSGTEILHGSDNINTGAPGGC